MVLKKSSIEFHRRSRYEDVLELVNDNEEALKPLPNRDAVFYKASNQGSYFDGSDHLDKLRVEQNRISERVMRDHMMRQYATDNGLTHRALFEDREVDENINSPRRTVAGGSDGFFDLDEDANYTRAELDGVLSRAEEARQANQQDITQAHQQQVEREQEQGEGVLRTLGRGTLRVGRNIAGGLATGQDLTTSIIGGLAEPVLSGIGDAVMRRVLPQQRPLLDLEAPRTPVNNPWNQAQLPPSIVLQPHQPNVGATQQPLPPAVQQLALPPVNIHDEPESTHEPRGRRGRPRNVQEGGASSSSSGNFRFPAGSARQEDTPEEERPNQPTEKRTRLTKKTSVKESSREDQNVSREELNRRPLIMPSKIGIQKLRETFEEANNKHAINTVTYRKYRSLYNEWITSKGDPILKKAKLKELQKLYKETVFNR